MSKKSNYGKNLAMLSFRNKNYFKEEEILRLKHFNTTQRIEHFFKSFLETKRINSFDGQL